MCEVLTEQYFAQCTTQIQYVSLALAESALLKQQKQQITKLYHMHKIKSTNYAK